MRRANAEWLALWTDDAVYWVPPPPIPRADPEKHLSHIYDNRSRLETRVKALADRPSLQPGAPSLMRRLISNIEVARAEDGEFVAASNFALAELSIQAKHETHWWVGRATHRLRRVDGELRIRSKKVVLINAAEPCRTSPS